MRLATALLQQLKHEGVAFLSAYPTTPLIDAAARIGIRPIICRQERVGVGIADGYTRLNEGRVPGVFAMQYGPGAENAFSGVSTAYADHVPMLLLPTGYPAHRSQVAPTFRSRATFENVTKRFLRIHDPGDLTDTVRMALAALRTGTPGPVMLEIPYDLAIAPVDDSAGDAQAVQRVVPSPAVDSIEAAAALLRTARRPVVLAGQGVFYANAGDALRQLAEQLALPVMTTLAGKSSFPEHHPLATGTIAAASSGVAVHFLERADVVLAVGTSLTKHVMTRTLPRDPMIIHITVDPDDLYKDYEIECPVLGDARIALELLMEALVDVTADSDTIHERHHEIASVDATWRAEWLAELQSSESPINPYRLVSELDTFLAGVDDSVLTHDSGSPRDQIVPFVRTSSWHGYIGWGKSHALGTGLGLIMGAKLARPEAVCINVMGDAAFGMVGLDFETAVRNQIPTITIVNNNYSMACEAPVMRVSHELYAARAIGGEYADMARAMGGVGIRVDDPHQIGTALTEAHRATLEGDTVLIELMTRPEDTEFSHRSFYE